MTLVCPSVFAIERSAAGVTVVPAVAVLLAALGSAGLPETLAELVIEPAAVGVTMIVTVAVAVLAIVPRLQVTVPPACEQVPWLGEAEMKVTPAGSVSVRVALVAVEGPPFATVTV